MNILIVNDDGINADGLKALINELKDDHNLTIVAPEAEKSGSSHSISIGKSLYLTPVNIPEYMGIDAYSVNGTPADCTKLGVTALGKDFDLVISGINLGENLGLDLLYSGTVNAAEEGILNDVPAMAISQHLPETDADKTVIDSIIKDTAKIAAQIINQTDWKPFAQRVCNVNFPWREIGNIKGIKVCRQGKRRYDLNFDKNAPITEREYNWEVRRKTDLPYNEKYETDWKWATEGYITITPMQWNKTDFGYMKELECKMKDIKLHI